MAYTKIPLFRRWVLQNFPFIEQDFDALTDYQLICKVVEYLNKCIETVNASTEQIEILTNAFNQLKDYVDHYFDNLDVQDEINNKIDEMVESGEFQEIISQLLMHHFVPVENYGAIGDGTTDDTQAIQDAIDDANENSVILFTKTYKTTDAITISNKKLILAGGGVIKPLITGNKNAILTDSDIVIKNITIDGSLNPQDQFDEHTFSNLVLLTGLYLQGENSIIENVTLKDIYGYGIRFRGYKQITINNCRIDSVGGHWYQNNENDSFGDAIYLGGTTGDSYININNTLINGKYKNTTLSRCGICVENLTDMADGVTNIRFTQGTLKNFDRMVHVESIQGNAKCYIEDVDMMGNCIYNHGTNANVGKLKLDINKSSIEYTTHSYNGTFGIRTSTIDIRDTVIQCGNQSIAFSNTVGSYRNCTFNNVATTQFNNATNIDIYDSIFNIVDISTYLNYGSNVNVYNCTFNSSTNITANRSGRSINVYGSSFINYLPHASYKDVKSIINMATGATYDANIKLNNRFTTFYINDELQHEPNLGASIPATDVNHYKYVTTNTSATPTIPLIPTITGFKLRPNAKYAVICYGTDNTANAWNFRKFSGVYLNIFTTNENAEVGNVGTTTILGSESSSFALTVDTTNKTVTKTGQYAAVIVQTILEVNDLNYIATYTA